MIHTARRQNGFTLIELVVVLLIIGILGTLVAMTYSGVQAKNRNNQREATIDKLQSSLEMYFFAGNTTRYPTLANLNDAAWAAKNLKHFDPSLLQDPSWNSGVKACTVGNKPVAIGAPTTGCIAYQVTTTEGNPCDNLAAMCAHYTLTAKLEGGGSYVKGSLN